MAAPNGEENRANGAQAVAKPPEGTILPPPTIREIIERVAPFVVRNGQAFESRIREGHQVDAAKISFLEPDDAYHAYYKWRLEEIRSGRTESGIAQKTDVSFSGKAVYVPPTPAEWKFSARMPNISAQDLEIVKLTALFAAKNGKNWLTGLSHKEAGNYQFDFLRPQHTLNMFFTRLTEQYQDLLNGDIVENGKPQKERIKEFEHNVQDRYHLLERAQKRAEYMKWLDKQKVEKEEKAEKERIAFAQIDWHDFEIVAQLDISEDEPDSAFSRPMTKNDIQSASLEQKASMRIGADRRLEENIPTFDDIEGMFGTAPQLPAAQLGPGQQTNAYQTNNYTQNAPTGLDRMRAAQEAAQQPARIRNDYIPQAQRRNAKAQNTSLCTICKQQIPNDELEAHMRIELMDPRWREQRDKNQQRSSTTNLSTADVANNLKRLASQRTDVFDPITGLAVSEEEQARRKRIELNAYDGVSNSNPGFVGPQGTHDKPTDVQEQIRQLHAKYGDRNG